MELVISNETINQIKELNDCPMCLQKVSLDHKAHIVENETDIDPVDTLNLTNDTISDFNVTNQTIENETNSKENHEINGW